MIEKWPSRKNARLSFRKLTRNNFKTTRTSLNHKEKRSSLETLSSSTILNAATTSSQSIFKPKTASSSRLSNPDTCNNCKTYRTTTSDRFKPSRTRSAPNIWKFNPTLSCSLQIPTPSHKSSRLRVSKRWRPSTLLSLLTYIRQTSHSSNVLKVATSN